MKKYKDYTKEQLIKVIEEKNITISRLNGEVYYYKNFKDKYQKLKKDSRNQQEEINKLKQQQLDKLEAENETLFKAIEKVNKINKRLELEKEELKKLLEARIEDLCDSCGASSMKLMLCRVYEKTLNEIREIAKPYQRDIDKICGYCRKYDSCHACCIDELKLYEYRTGTTKACERFVESERFNINIVANKILQKISEVEE